MKRTILTLAALLMTWLFASAQFNFGIKGGYNSSINLGNMTSVNPENYALNNLKGELANGFHLGAFTRIGGRFMYNRNYFMVYRKRTINLQFKIFRIRPILRILKITLHLALLMSLC